MYTEKFETFLFNQIFKKYYMFQFIKQVGWKTKF